MGRDWVERLEIGWRRLRMGGGDCDWMKRLRVGGEGCD